MRTFVRLQYFKQYFRACVRETDSTLDPGFTAKFEREPNRTSIALARKEVFGRAESSYRPFSKFKPATELDLSRVVGLRGHCTKIRAIVEGHAWRGKLDSVEQVVKLTCEAECDSLADLGLFLQ